MLENMQQLDAQWLSADDADEDKAPA